MAFIEEIKDTSAPQFVQRTPRKKQSSNEVPEVPEISSEEQLRIIEQSGPFT
jgi:hypothetical protein